MKKPIFLRGTLECCIFPLTGTPPTDEASWEKLYASAREYGMNHLRFTPSVRRKQRSM